MLVTVNKNSVEGPQACIYIAMSCVRETKLGLTLRDVADRWAAERLVQLLIGSGGPVDQIVENTLTGTFAGSERLSFTGHAQSLQGFFRTVRE